MPFVLCSRALLLWSVSPARWVVVFEYVIITILMLHQVRLLHLFNWVPLEYSIINSGIQVETEDICYPSFINNSVKLRSCNQMYCQLQ